MSLPLPAVRFLVAQLKAQGVPHFVVLPTGKDFSCCTRLEKADKSLTPPKRPPTA